MNIRKAKLEDATFSYECRNDYEARINARNTEYIDYKTHEEWFKKSIKDISVVFYIGELNSEKIGVVRVNYGNPTEVMIHLHPEKRKQGNGTILLRKSIEEFVKENNNEKRLMSTIRPDNIGSIKIFEKINFKANGEKDPKDNGFDVYILNIKKQR